MRPDKEFRVTIDGSILIGSRAMRRSATFHAANPATGETLPQAYCEATADEVAAACALAEAASRQAARLDGKARFSRTCRQSFPGLVG